MFLYLSLYVLSVCGESKPPVLPDRFTYTADVSANDPLFPVGVITFWQDAALKSQREEAIARPFNQSRIANYSFMQNHLRASSVMSGVCHGLLAPYSPMYAWVPLSQYKGTVQIGNKTCELWALEKPNATQSMAFYEGVPVQIESNYYGKSEFGPEYGWDNQTQLISSFDASSQPFPAWLFETADSCFNPDALICSGGGVSNLTVYRFHEPTFQGLLSNQDVGDLVGDVFFVCTESVLTPEYQWLSQFELSVNTSWSSYAACNGDPPHCDFGSRQLVGREAALSLSSDYAGQCTTNDDIGSWFSLPAAGECLGGSSVAPGCSWKELQRVKTINASCLIGHGFVDACRKDAEAPFKLAQAVFSKAFESEDVSQGGCPALSGLP